jgi:PAS domain S-box-containing protein
VSAWRGRGTFTLASGELELPGGTIVGAKTAESKALAVDVYTKTADGVYAVDSRQRIVYWNSSAQQIMGWRPDEVVGKHCYEVISGGDYEGQRFCRRNCPIITAARRAKPVGNYDVLSRRKDSSSLWLNISIILPPEGSRNGICAVHVFRDVSERRRSEQLAQTTLETVARFSTGEGGQVETKPYPPPGPPLTQREVEVLRLLASGVPTEDIATTLGVSRSTARNHIESILAKLGVHSRLQAVVYASRHRLI